MRRRQPGGRTCVGDLHRLTHMPVQLLSARYLRLRGQPCGLCSPR